MAENENNRSLSPHGTKPPFARTMHDLNSVPGKEMPPPIRGDAPIAKGSITDDLSPEQLIRGADLLPSLERSKR